MAMDKKIWVALAVLVVLAVGAWALTSTKSDSKTSSNSASTAQTESTQNDGRQTSDSTTQTPASATNKVQITGFAFSPNTITVKVGDTVTWENMDSAAHTVTSSSAEGPKSGTLQQGQSYSYKFTQAGTYNYACKFHPSMVGSVTVQ